MVCLTFVPVVLLEELERQAGGHFALKRGLVLGPLKLLLGALQPRRGFRVCKK